MSGFKDIVKGGWHPEKNRASSSSGSSSTGLNKVRGMVGRGGGDATTAAHSHQSAPLTTLVDPASFGPPPKHIHYHGAAAAAATSNSAPRPPPRAPQHPSPQPSPSPTATGPPRLPPRLPPRQNSNPHELTPAPPPAYHEIDQPVHAPPQQPGQLNQGALSRLGNAGVNVPGFNIGHSASPPIPSRRMASPPPLSPTSSNNGAQVGELQSRFANMSTQSSDSPSTGTTWAQKQAALKTAGNLRQDPSKVSVSDMRSAASTANNFRERHGEQAAAGWKTANGLNQKYGISNKVGGLASSSASTSNTPPGPPSPVGKKPPPPPPKRKGLSGNTVAAEANEPPPIPLSSKPKF
ncbi:unnamed protein product [Periconia digitata]|uniref:Uncharacterized protein n=1 Tax=Periconia digitata TaxID=1303443 RepID=A0A9W4XSU4_9PLEO|nr:unnamed protein product [Periconia digitata]